MSEENNPFKYYAVSGILSHREDKHVTTRVNKLIAARTGHEAIELFKSLYSNNDIIVISETSLSLFELEDLKYIKQAKVII